ncbi:MAG: hypothetical protein KGH75_01345 [Rhodospirillales bacterium]|nr:hypothetical protein [Rhodospirillales bacterium]
MSYYSSLRVFLLVTLTSCTQTIPVNVPTISATQQLVANYSENKAIKSLQDINFNGNSVFVDTSFIKSDIQVPKFNEWLLDHNARLSDKKQESTITVVPFTPVYSYNYKSLLLGVPKLNLSFGWSTPEVAFYAKSTDTAIYQIRFYAYYTQTGKLYYQDYSKFGVQSFSVTKVAFMFTYETPKLDSKLIAK